MAALVLDADNDMAMVPVLRDLVRKRRHDGYADAIGSRLKTDLIEQPGRKFPTVALAAEVADYRQAECVGLARYYHRQFSFQ